MKVEQISVFLENRAGRLAEVTKTLADNQINIRALSLADTSDFGILRLIVPNGDKATEALKTKGFTVGRTNVVAVEVGDKPGGLHATLELLNKGGVNVEYMYAFVTQSGSNAVLIFRFDNTDKAIDVLRQNKVHILSGEELYSL